VGTLLENIDTQTILGVIAGGGVSKLGNTA
jgi:hypothetical protein